MSSASCINLLTENPTKAWKEMESNQKVLHMDPMKLDTPISPNMVRFVCVSDTHSLINRMKHPIPDGDVFIHAGDFTRLGDSNEIRTFNKFLGTLPHKHKIVIAGNHELSFDPNSECQVMTGFTSMKIRAAVNPTTSKDLPTPTDPRALLTNCTYLEDCGTQVYGLQIYGSPWQPEYGGWAFNLKRGEQCLEKWDKIPDTVDVLVTHGPPIGHGDLCATGVRAGCVELLTTVQERVKPKYHVFGHIHEGYGITTDGTTVFVNCSICNLSYAPINPPIIFDFPLPSGVTKS